MRFVIVQLVNDPQAGSGGMRPATGQETVWSLLPRGLTGPATVLGRTRDARGVNSSSALARRVLALGGTYLAVRLGQSPTGRTAPLGWSLSAAAEETIDGQWTPRCRDRVLRGAGFRGDGGPPGTGAGASDPMQMDLMAMWSDATCRAVVPPER